MTANSYTIRELSPSEWQIFKLIRTRAVAENPTAFLPTSEEVANTTDAYWQSVGDTFGHTLFLFVCFDENNNPMGKIGLMVETSWKISHVGKLYYMYVAPQARKKGIGQKLLETAIEKGKALGLKIVTLDLFATQEAAFALYSSQGFRECGRIPKFFRVPSQINYIDKIDMYRSLD